VASREDVVIALRAYIAEAKVLAPNGQQWVDANGKPMFLYIAEAMMMLKQLDTGTAP